MAATTDAPALARDIHASDFDEMWHGMPSKKRHAGSSKPWSIPQGARLPGDSVVVMLPRANACMTKENISQTVYCIRIIGRPWPRFSPKSALALGKPTRRLLSEITPRRDTILLACHARRKRSPHLQTWDTHLSSCGVPCMSLLSSPRIRKCSYLSLHEHVLLTASKKWTCDLPMTRATSRRHVFEANTNRFALIPHVHCTQSVDHLAQEASIR